MTGTRILAELNKGVYSTSIDCKLTQTVFQGQSHNQDMVAAKLLISVWNMTCQTHHPLVCPPFFDKWNVLVKCLNWEKKLLHLLQTKMPSSINCWRKASYRQRRNVNLIGHSLSYGPPGWDGIAEIMFYDWYWTSAAISKKKNFPHQMWYLILSTPQPTKKQVPEKYCKSLANCKLTSWLISN